ncbi:MAG: DnaJ domain-containing protein [Caldilineaceae bacterium]|nr:DnaJ domain-containing protein [Caldilineaceae bacterium]MBP8123113.1 DnaJ domain-containing protein [Caldilineaceae bacterium]MBP9071945.1 DnaJ domain-containing protein [Caldilineaceae bacterium]
MEYKDYYSTLGVAKGADEKEIKKAYRQLAREFHPDVNKDNPSAEARFKEVNEAYAVLSDADKRAKYDRFGSQWERYEKAGVDPNNPFTNMGGRGRSGFGGSGRTISPEEFQQMFGGMGGFGGGGGGSGNSSFFDALFGGMGGSAGGFGPQPRTAQARPRSQDVPVEITLEEAFYGGTRTLIREDNSRIEASIPRGVKTGSKIRMSGAAGGSDLFLKVDVLPHAQFQRDGDDLTVSVPIDLYTALLGGEAEVPTVDSTVVLTIPAGSQNGKKMRLRGLGMPHLRNPEQRGDLIAVLDVQLPGKLNAKEIALFEQLRALRA